MSSDKKIPGKNREQELKKTNPIFCILPMTRIRDKKRTYTELKMEMGAGK